AQSVFRGRVPRAVFCFWGGGGGGAPAGGAGFPRLYLSQSSEAIAAWSWRQAEITQCRPGAGCKAARGHRTRPRDPGMPPRPRPYRARFDLLYVTEMGTNVNVNETK